MRNQKIKYSDGVVEKRSSGAGFTLVELLLVMGIIGVLLTISSILLLNLLPKASLKSESEVLISQLRSQQLSAMSGEAYNTEEPSYFGIYFQNQTYTLFRGTDYDPAEIDNYEMVVDEPIQLSTTFPDQKVVFEAGSGEILNFTPGSSSITLSNSQTNETKTINLNQYGVVTQ